MPSFSRPWSTVILLAAVAVVCVVAGLAAISFYERALNATLPVTPSIQGMDETAGLTFIGDSRVAQWARHDGFDARYLGFSGATSSQIELYLTRAAVGGGVVVLQLGVNDLRILGIRPKLSENIVSMVVTSIQRTVNLLSERYETVIVLGVFPVTEPELLRRPVWSAAVGEAVGAVNRNLADLTYPENAKFVSTEPVFERLGEQAFRDTLHITGDAYLGLNALLQESISNAL